MQVFGQTHIGNVRSNNEDSFAIETALNTVIVADGMGGASCGEVASAITVESVLAYLAAPTETLDTTDRLREAIRSANRDVWETAKHRTECNGMGSTIVLAHWNEQQIWIQNSGDSRAYRFRGGGLQQLSYDQNVGNELRHSLGLTDEQVNRYPQRNVLTMAVGVGDEISVRCYDEAMEANDLYLLCSDGLYGPVSEEEVAAILRKPLDLPAMAAELINISNHHGGPDNITVALLRNA